MTQMIDVPKYTDDDIRADFARLHTIASDYLRKYGGSFQPMRAARAVVCSGEALTVQQLRIVCNTMTQDFAVKGMPEPQGHLGVFDASRFGRTVSKFQATPQTRIRVAFMKCKARPNPLRPFWYSVNRMARVIHVAESIDVEYKTELWYEGREWYDLCPPYHERFTLKPRSMCKYWYQWPKGLRAISLPMALSLIEHEGRYWCPTCYVKAEASGVILKA